MFGVYYCSAEAYLLVDGGDLLCPSCARSLVREEVTSRYVGRFGEERAERLADLAIDRLYALSDRTEREKAEAYFTEKLGFSILPLSSYNLDAEACENPFAQCADCGEEFFPDLVREVEGKGFRLERFLNSWNRFKDLFLEEFSFGNILLPEIFSDLRDLRKYLILFPAKGISFSADRFLEIDPPFLADSPDGLLFSVSGTDESFLLRIVEIEPARSSYSGLWYLVREKDARGKKARIFRKLWDRLFGSEDLYNDARETFEETDGFSFLWDGVFPIREEVFSALQEVESFQEFLEEE